MLEALLSALALFSSSSCVALTGTHADAVVVDKASLVPPTAAWEPSPTPAEARPGSSLRIERPFCRVEGRIEDNIGFELWLPQDWNGRLLGAGVGGPAGTFNYRDMSLRLGQGFATITSDAGHKAYLADARVLDEGRPQ